MFWVNGSSRSQQFSLELGVVPVENASTNVHPQGGEISGHAEVSTVSESCHEEIAV
jgi:hypothetical protein